jgi:hypoxanthine phosphoribosyltransferase
MNTRQTLALFMKAIKGYYVSREIFISLDHPSKTYYIPSKKEWEWTQLKMKYGPTLMVLKTG